MKLCNDDDDGDNDDDDGDADADADDGDGDGDEKPTVIWFYQNQLKLKSQRRQLSGF